MDKEYVLHRFLTESFSLHPDTFLEGMYQALDYKTERGNMYVWDNTFVETVQKHTRNSVALHAFRNINDEGVESWNDFVKQQYRPIRHEGEFNSPFLFMLHMVRDLLLIEKDGIVFKINKVESWQTLTQELGEDLFTTALFADTYAKRKIEPTHFQWNYILASNFTSLNGLLKQQGVAENHFHLYGSSPNVDLSWLSLMNQPWERDRDFEKIRKELLLQPTVNYKHTQIKQSDIYLLVRIAAYIRLKLFQRCCMDGSGEQWNLISLIREIRTIQKYNNLLAVKSFKEDIQAYRMLSSYEVEGIRIDYAIQNRWVRTDLPYAEISGERHLYYQCLNYIYKNKEKSVDVQILFYLYIIIKKYFDGIFIQKNDKYGFDNFHKYQNRKLWFIDGTIYEKLVLKLALDSNIKENFITDFEVRIGFNKAERHIGYIDETLRKFQYKDTLLQHVNAFQRELMNSIQKYQNLPYFRHLIEGYTKIVEAQGKNDPYFFVLHFAKTKIADWSHDEKEKIYNNCRESKLRTQIKREAMHLIRIRKEKHSSAYRIYGIDAASHEINCRPEVFGQAFRYISQYQDVYSEITQKKLPQLRKTYHVGEDFYDIVDGLRAIDEAVLYLDLQYGDRIGHATALALDVNKYYSRERRTIAMPLQNVLDNVAWILYKIEEWNIEVSQCTYAYLSDKFQHYFTQVYYDPDNKISGSCECVSDLHGFEVRFLKKPRVSSCECVSDLHSYIESWKLRGDNPECYEESLFSESFIRATIRTRTLDWDRANFRQIEKYRNMDKNVYYLYHRYHFDFELKKRASKKTIIEITTEYINVVRLIQLKIRTFILQKGIGIESNPTSNFLISNLKDFSDVPLFNLFPIVEPNQNGYMRLNTSVNTDDQGVFYTSLTKEYTLLAGTLQQQKDENGMRKYSDHQILEWIAHLIENGKRQSFVNM